MKIQKILFVQTPAFHKNKGGVQRITYNLGCYFTQEGWQVDYFSFAQRGHERTKTRNLFYPSLEGGVQERENIAYLKQILTYNKYDFVINQMPYEAPIRRCLRDNKGKAKVIGCIHNSLFSFKTNAKVILDEMLPTPLNRVAKSTVGLGVIQQYHKRKHSKDLRRIIDQHDFVLLYTPPNLDELKFFVGEYKLDKIGFMPNPVPSISNQIGEKEKLILHVGRLNTQQKRSDLLLDFWEKLSYRLPDWQFVIVGDGPYFNQLKRRINRKKVPRVELVGFQEPEPYYRRASLFMMPSAFEGFPNTIIEAQSFGCPVFAFNNYAALPWIVNDGKDAMISEPFRTDKMAKDALALVQNPKRLSLMQQRSQANAQRFGIEKIGQEWKKLFSSLEENVVA